MRPDAPPASSTMDELDQFVTMPSQPCLQLQPPTPLAQTTPRDGIQQTFVLPAPPSASSPVPIPTSRPASRPGTASSSVSRSATRHHPYSGSPASFASSTSERSFRPRSATSNSDRTDWESEASAYETDFEARIHHSPEALAFSPLDLPFYDDPVLPRPPTSNAASSFVAKPPRIGKNGKPVKSHARKTAPGHIKRPPNAFILFRSHCCAPKPDEAEFDPPGTAHARNLARLNINKSQHVSVIVSELWRGLSTEDKAYWEQKAQEAKEEHQRLYPEYRYRPQQRAKEAGRKRKLMNQVETEESRSACHEVARLVLEQEGSAPSTAPSTRRRARQDVATTSTPELPSPPPTSGGLMDEVLGGGSTSKAKSTKSRPKRKTRSTRRTKTDDATEPYGSPLELPIPPAQFDTYASGPAAPFPSVLAGSDFSEPLGRPGRRLTPENDPSRFAFLAQLEDQYSLPGQTASPDFPLDPQLGLLSTSVDGPAPHPLSRPPTASQAAFPDQLINPFSTGPTAPLAASAPPSPERQPLFRPPSPTSIAIQRMQSYSLGGPSPPLPLEPTYPPTPISSASDFTFGTFSPPSIESTMPLAQRRDIQFPPNLPLAALKHRRSTIRPGQPDGSGRGDLMLISPLTTTFKGRRQSVGWSSGVRRISLSATALAAGQGDENTPFPAYRKTSLSAGVLSANDSFEAFSFPQDVLESLPLENAFDSPETLSQLVSTSLPTPYDDDENRPNTATSAWSTDDSIEAIERLEGGFPAGYFDRRRSTLVASKLSSGANSPGYHLGSTDFFTNPAPVLSPPTTGAGSESAVPAFGSAEFGGSFQPFAHRPSFGSLLASALSAYDSGPTPAFATDGGSNPVAGEPQDRWIPTSTAESMRDTALSVLHDRREQATPTPAAECEYVFLPIEQLDNVELMAKLHQQGYGIAFEAAPLATTPAFSQSQNHGLASGATIPLDESLLSA
ncbi:hypothetical protein JCM10212_004650 [Sporobolomyces blumeae]